MNSLRKMYTLVGIVSLLYSGVISSNFFSSRSLFFLSKLTSKLLFNVKKLKKLSERLLRKKNKGPSQSSFLDENMKDEALDKALLSSRKAAILISLIENSFNSNPNFKKKIEENFYSLSSEYYALKAQEFSGTKKEKKKKEKDRKSLVIKIENLDCHLTCLYHENLNINEALNKLTEKD